MGEFEIPCEFQTHHLDFEMSPLLPLMSLKLIWNSSKFWTQPLVIDFEFRDASKRVSNVSIQFKMHLTLLVLVIFLSFLRLFMTFLCNKWPMRVCHMLHHLSYYINSLSSRLKRFVRSLTFCGKEDEKFGLFLLFFIEYIVFIFFWFNSWIFTLLWIVSMTSPSWDVKKLTRGLKHENLKARNL